MIRQTKRKLMTSCKEDIKESKEADYDGNKNQLEEEQERETGEFNEETTNNVF